MKRFSRLFFLKECWITGCPRTVELCIQMSFMRMVKTGVWTAAATWAMPESTPIKTVLFLMSAAVWRMLSE